MKIWKSLFRATALAIVLLTSAKGFAEENVFNLHITKGRVPENHRVIRVTKGDNVKWEVVSDAPGELHLHAYHLSLHLNPGETSDLSFQAFATGRFRMEWHPATSSNKKIDFHHEDKLASFEVMPK